MTDIKFKTSEGQLYLEIRWKLQKWGNSLEYLQFYLSKSSKFHFCNFYFKIFNRSPEVV